AIYIGGSRFGARAYADNPETEELLALMDMVHENDKRIYLTVNTLLKQREIEEGLYDYILPFYENGLDAVIVQDLGVADYISKAFPLMPIHLSTQMSVVGGEVVSLFKDMNVTRIVPARELSLEEVASLKKSSGMEIETFIHGALCYCYSGQCLLSSLVGERSGNRGRCAQPCRLKYSLYDGNEELLEGKYLLSPKDINTLKHIGNLMECGIDSFKIEGRMKKPQYTAGVAASYKLVTNVYLEYGIKKGEEFLKENPELLKNTFENTLELYNRGGTTNGYFFNYHGKQMMSPERPNHYGYKVGEVKSVKGINAGIKYNKSLTPGDVLEIRLSDTDFYEFTVGKRLLEEKQGEYTTNVAPSFKLKEGLPVYRTKNAALLDKIEEDYLKKEPQYPVYGKLYAYAGSKAVLTIERKSEIIDDILISVRTDEELEPAQNKPTDKEALEKTLNKTGESKFRFEGLEIETDGKTFIPVGTLKNLRRKAFEELEEKIGKEYKRNIRNVKKPASPDLSKYKESEGKTVRDIIVQLTTVEQYENLVDTDLYNVMYLDIQNSSLNEQLAMAERAAEAGKEVYLVLPHIFREKDKKRYEAFAEKIEGSKLDGFLIHNLEELVYTTSLKGKFKIRTDSNLYCMNSFAEAFLKDRGVERITTPVEETCSEIKEALNTDFDTIIYGRPTVMVSTQCLRDNYLKCEKGRVTDGLSIRNEEGNSFPVRQICTSCLNLIYDKDVLNITGLTEEVDDLSPRG
ncbi:MAG: U32 family peptidase, partial [Lachnospiraceae bacterium]|nr:U32 family peptidase [Lachnospiraceae bacterium]